MNTSLRTKITVFILGVSASCGQVQTHNIEMVNLLKQVRQASEVVGNNYSARTKVKYFDSLYNITPSGNRARIEYSLGNAYLEMGNEEKSIPQLTNVLNSIDSRDISTRRRVMRDIAISWLRYGERTNCINGHTTESCIFPVKGAGVHKDPSGSQQAIKIYEQLLKEDSTDLESRWLLNIAYMTINGYPDKVPREYLLQLKESDTLSYIKPFQDASVKTGLNTNNLAGGSVIDDFNNDGYLDLITSSMSLYEGMHYCQNNRNGTFSDFSEESGLKQLTGGLNLMQTDYNNDGYKDIFVTRGGWKGQYGKEPNSLLRNNGDGTFTDVTKESGMLSFFPTQTAVWADFNNDGWLDVFIGNEYSVAVTNASCELYINNQDGTFKEVSKKAGMAVFDFVKGVTAGDYDNDGLTDIYISSNAGNKYLFKNKGNKDGLPRFENVTGTTGLARNNYRTFSTWFMDYDNDGWLDIVVCGYHFDCSLSIYAAAEVIGGKNIAGSGRVFLYRNNHDGTFEDVSLKSNLMNTAFAMGSNYGDIDNDGYLDFYLATGNPEYSSLVPNKLFKNIEGKSFVDITNAARVGNLQKGHGVSIADLDNDGDQDIHVEMGGAYEGDGYQSALYLNPGQNDNNYINLSFKGTKANRPAIGTRLKVTFYDNGNERSVYRVVSSGSSFGANPLMQFVGIGKATKVKSLEITWPGDTTKQVINNLDARKTYLITEGSSKVEQVKLQSFDFMKSTKQTISCEPARLN